ncbi:hypothetical protein [Paraburkholderia sp. J67]|uniref:hypothetical protein n=1 Tax=Paraburkholderia sp. J67 TaxID=2805435 RepID=UPI002ABD6D3A|nr:hypothetical protein [Paraburkholderia sp. J67]
MFSLQTPMIKKPEDLKSVFLNGAIPTQMDFADLIDSFVPKDELSDADLGALRELIAWWRSGNARTGAPGDAASGTGSNPGTGAPLTPVEPLVPVQPLVPVEPPAPAIPPAPVVPAAPGIGATPAGAPSSGTATSCVVPADGKWHPLPITDKTVGTWACTAATVNARPGYRIVNNAIAVIGTQLSARRLVQSVDRDSLIPWHTLQFKWLPETGSTFQLNVRARSAFGSDTAGKAMQIQCRWSHQD